MRRMKLALLNLFRNRRRSLLSVSIVAIAVMALMASGGFGLYTYQSLQESAARTQGHLTFAQSGYFDSDEDFPLQNGLEDAASLSRKLLMRDGVKAVQPRIYFTGLISNGEKSTIFVGQGVEASEFRLKGPFMDISSGKTLSPDEAKSNPQIMLGKGLARNLKVNTGDYITLMTSTVEGALNAIDFQVRGIYSAGVPELDKRQIYVSLPAAQSLLDSTRVSTISVYAYELSSTEELRQQLSNIAPELEITSWEERAFFYDKVKGLYNRIFGVMGLVMALVVFVALFNTLTMSVTERTREIGTLSALGTARSELLLNFMCEGLLLALAGALIGIALTAMISVSLMVLEVEMPPPPGSTNGYPLMIYFSSSLAWMITLGVSIICVVSSFLAARKGVNKPITEALIHV